MQMRWVPLVWSNAGRGYHGNDGMMAVADMGGRQMMIIITTVRQSPLVLSRCGHCPLAGGPGARGPGACDQRRRS
jgi:hypothetical protein